MTIQEELRIAIEELRNAGVDTPERDARWLMGAVLGGREKVTLRLREDLPPDMKEVFFSKILERKRRRPMSHILGGREFYGRWFEVTPDVLDPRPETEILVECALKKPFSCVLDLGTGSGAIAVTLLAETGAQGVASDISPAALEVAKRNAKLHGVDQNLLITLSDWCDAVLGNFDLIVSNPPYIALSEMSDISPEVRQEPRIALTDEGDGLAPYRKIAAGLPQYLAPGGRVLLEIGPTQAVEVHEILSAVDMVEISTVSDFDGRDRVVSARRPGNSDIPAKTL